MTNDVETITMAEREGAAMLSLLWPEGFDDTVAVAAARVGAWAQLVAEGKANVEFFGQECPIGVFVQCAVMWASMVTADDSIFDGMALQEVSG